MERFWSELDGFVERCLQHAGRFGYDRPIATLAPLAPMYLILLATARSVPPRLAREFAKLLSTCGFRRAGAMLWDDTVERLIAAEFPAMIPILTKAGEG